MNEYYECHITLHPEFRERVEPIAKQAGFKISIIAGDEVLGDAKHLYCTSHDKNFEGMQDKMRLLTISLTEENIPFIRRKIEHIVFDERTPK